LVEPVEFGLLGPLIVRCGRTMVPVQRGGQRAVLAALLLAANRVVPVRALAEVLWGPEPPPSAPVVIRNHIRRLRQALGEPARERIRTQPGGGYLINVAEGELDVARFEHLLSSARAAARQCNWPEAAGQARTALALWRGEPLADIESEMLAAREVPRLAELRMQAAETRAESELHLGGHTEVVAELQGLAAAHPLREHLHALLMLAMYRSGRQADALAAYRQVRAVLVEELGTEPGAELAELHQRILAADPALLLREPAAPTTQDAAPTAAGHARADPPTGLPTAVPRQLPGNLPGFTGREDELAALAQILDEAASQAPGTVVISAVGGTAGVGKTTLAVHWAHQVADRFSDGQLYVNLRGFGPADAPAAPAEAIRGFLTALGVPPERIPPGADAQEGLYRSLLADRRVLIVLDNARDEQQVRPLLPGGPGCMAIVTSRSQLRGLAATDGARLLTVDTLSPDEAIRMLETRLGSRRATAEPRAVSEIAALCAYLPLALAIAASRAEARPRFPLAALAAELRDTSGLLDILDADDSATSVRAVFSWSYRQLSPAAARLFRLLGLHPAPGISLPAAASLAGTNRQQAGAMMRELAQAHLVIEHAPGRYTTHDLLRAYAAEQARIDGTEADRREATGRLLDHYLHTAHDAALLLYSSREPITLAPARPGVTPERLTDRQQALAWFETEHQVMLAAVALAAKTGFDVHAWQLPWAMMSYLDQRGQWHDLYATQRIAQDAATRLGDLRGLALTGRALARACTRLADYAQARAILADCLQLYRKLGDHIGEAHTHQSLSLVAEHQGRYEAALAHGQAAHLLFQSVGHQPGQAQSLNIVGWDYSLLGNYERAREVSQQAVELSREVGEGQDEALAWDSLGYAEFHLGHLDKAVDCYARALRLYREIGHRYLAAQTLTRLSETHHAAGQLSQALSACQEALDILEDLGNADASRVRAKLASMRKPDTPGPV
jgi:DNA-binding SARP family transcriptional activator/tetratricopeptide (TPR) repeat protein